MDTPELIVDTSLDHIVVLTLNRPQRLNALSNELVGRLCEQLDLLSQQEHIRIVVITGAGRAFCAGWDLNSPMTDAQGCPMTGPLSVRDNLRGQERFSSVIKRLRALDKVVIAAVNGAAVGAGMAIALASDIRVAAHQASFHVGAVRIGLTAGECGISYHLPRLIGASRAFEIMLTGRPVNGEEADRIGLVSALTKDGDTVLSSALTLAADVLRNSPYSISHTKQLMWSNLEAGSLTAAIELENHAQVLALMTDDFKEAAAAFAEKRPPQFSGR